VGKIFGVVEGFYRRPYTFVQRLDLIGFLSAIQLNTYLYGPKADPFHRKKWQEPYPKRKLDEFRKLNTLCKAKKVNFVYALSPMHDPNLEDVIKKIDTMMAIGLTRFSIFFDDIRVPLNRTTAAIQLRIVNGLYEHLQSQLDSPWLSFCPTQYRGFTRTEYLESIAAELKPKIDIFWTGKNVIAKRITGTDIDKITQILGRQVLVWDNIFANDYIPGKIHRFPYQNREPGIVDKLKGILLNPMNNYQKSTPLIHTAAQFFKDPIHYDAKKAWKIAESSAD
jgi:hyaluronoglucosaminidase